MILGALEAGGTKMVCAIGDEHATSQSGFLSLPKHRKKPCRK